MIHSVPLKMLVFIHLEQITLQITTPIKFFSSTPFSPNTESIGNNYELFLLCLALHHTNTCYLITRKHESRNV